MSHLNLSGPVIAEIFLGQITNWNDPAIAELNKGETLPNEKITPVCRNDGSGDTYVFTTFLSKVSSAWANKVGAGTVGLLPGRAPAPRATAASPRSSPRRPGAIGNNSWFYIRQAGLKAVAVENSAGNFVYPYDPYVVDAAPLREEGAVAEHALGDHRDDDRQLRSRSSIRRTASRRRARSRRRSRRRRRPRTRWRPSPT